MTDYLIVDGYNILHAWNSLKGLLKEDFEHARLRLIDILGDYRAAKGIKVLVVFDAHMVKGGAGSKETVNGVEVIYTAEGETADMAIEKLAGKVETGGVVTVATSDWAQQRIVFGRGAVRLSARELEQEVMSCRKEMQDHFGNQVIPQGLGRYISDEIREILEKIRRQK
ncbi:MAG: hypothetical protein CVU89_17125 [Firmicutes bacterium HGW-Firmicutes-14]|nr:MAG: hypothetical protein CVU89_17125 [Firmicutes bacterium HGW-Firmicutes-14]